MTCLTLTGSFVNCDPFKLSLQTYLLFSIPSEKPSAFQNPLSFWECKCSRSLSSVQVVKQIYFFSPTHLANQFLSLPLFLTYSSTSTSTSKPLSQRDGGAKVMTALKPANTCARILSTIDHPFTVIEIEALKISDLQAEKILRFF